MWEGRRCSRQEPPSRRSRAEPRPRHSPPPTAPYATSLSSTEATLEWCAPSASSSVCGYRIYAQQHGIDGFWVLVADTGTRRPSATVRGLTPLTWYEFQIAPVYSGGVCGGAGDAGEAILTRGADDDVAALNARRQLDAADAHVSRLRYVFRPPNPFLPYVAPHFSHISHFILFISERRWSVRLRQSHSGVGGLRRASLPHTHTSCRDSTPRVRFPLHVYAYVYICIYIYIHHRSFCSLSCHYLYVDVAPFFFLFSPPPPSRPPPIYHQRMF